MADDHTTWQPGDWAWSVTHRAAVQVLEVTGLWGSVGCRVWLPGRDAVVLVPAADLRAAGEGAGAAGSPERERARLRYVLTAARLANLLTEDVLLAPVNAAVIPLPHQIRALRRAVSQDRVRFLLADEVGLGKTIEAGLILRELKLRGLVTRTLVVAPRGLVGQWMAEMSTRFGEELRLFEPAEFPAFRRMSPAANVWQTCNQVICSLDSVKPVDGRRGWSPERLAQYNRDRFVDLVSAGWDLVIVDEAHRLGGSSEQVARHQLGKALAEAAPYLLLLSATPHQGKSDAFQRLVALLDARAFPDAESVARERVLPYVIRTEKRQAISADGQPLFKPRRTQLVPIPWGAAHEPQHQLYEAVTEYVREGYNRALRENQRHIGFLMVLMQRLVSSSTRAIVTTLERRIEALRQPDEQLELFPLILEEEWEDMDGQSQLETVLRARLKAMKGERQEVELLLDAARQVQARGPDAKATALLDWIYQLRQDEGDPDMKVLVFTEFVPTQQMLAEFLADRGFAVVCLNGSMDMDERARAQQRFAEAAQVLISTDAGGEGLNLQFCHVVVNYDIPWNPMRLEQRIGRVDRIGQDHVVRAVNLALENTVEFRVREVLEQKLAVILAEFGVDKTSDVLDSAEAGNVFDNLYIDAILHPERLDADVERTVAQVREEARQARQQASVFQEALPLDPEEARRVAALPLSDWVEGLVGDYLEAQGGSLRLAEDGTLDVTWPGADAPVRMVLPARAGQSAAAGTEMLSLDHPRVRAIIASLPRAIAAESVPAVRIAGLPEGIAGHFSLWQVTLNSTDRQRQRVLPVFVHDDGRVLQPTARFLWEQLSARDWQVVREARPLADGPSRSGALNRTPVANSDRDPISPAAKEQDDGRDGVGGVATPGTSPTAASRAAALSQGESVFRELQQRHLNQLRLEKEKGDYSFKARRRLLDSVGLAPVQAHRLRRLQSEEAAWRLDLARREQMVPELRPILLVRVLRR